MAIERGLIELVEATGQEVPELCRPSDLINLLYRGRKPLAPYLEGSTRVYGQLSNIAHGREVTLAKAVKLIRQADKFVTEWRQVRETLVV